MHKKGGHDPVVVKKQDCSCTAYIASGRSEGSVLSSPLPGRESVYRIMYMILLLSVSSVVTSNTDDCPVYECPAKEGSFADPCTCRRFYQCVDFLPVQTHCPSGLWWDDIK